MSDQITSQMSIKSTSLHLATKKLRAYAKKNKLKLLLVETERRHSKYFDGIYVGFFTEKDNYNDFYWE